MFNMRKIMGLIILIGVSLLSYPHISHGFWYELKSPFPSHIAQFNALENKAHECPAAPAPPPHMNFISKYTDKTNNSSIVDPKAEQAYMDQIESIQKFERGIYKNIENTLIGRDLTRGSLNCVISWLSQWANKNAMLDIEISNQGQAVRKWSLASFSSAYIQIKNTEWIDKKKKIQIETWLQSIAYQVIEDYERDESRPSRNNNHLYWAAWSVMVTGVMTNDRKLYKWAIQNYKKAIKQIDDNGSLPLELSRQSKAFHYHIFAVSPLIMMAETAKKNGYNLYKYKQGRLLKLVDFILNELDNGQIQTKQLTRTSQDLTKTITSGQLAWLVIYNKNFKDPRADQWIKNLAPMDQRRIGGNLTLIYSDE